MTRLVSKVIAEAGHIRDVRIPFTLKYIQALLCNKEKYSVKFLDNMLSGAPFDKVLDDSVRFCPDIAVILATTLEQELVIKYASEIKKTKDCFVLVIGQDASFSVDKYIYKGSTIDAVIRGECELSFMEFLDNFEKGTEYNFVVGFNDISHLSETIALVENPDVLPFPIYNKEEIFGYKLFYPLALAKRIVWGHILSSRGCPYDCLFCSQTIRESYSKKIVFRSVDNIVDEIEYLKAHGVNVIVFADDNFTTSRGHVISVCREIIRRKLRIHWTAHARIDNCDKELLKIMKKSGCILLRFGIESGSEKVISTLKKTNISDWIGKSKEVFKYLSELRIPALAMFLIGNPGETEEDIRKSVKLTEELDPDFLQICFFTPYPGSAAYVQFKDKLDLLDTKVLYHYNNPPISFSEVKTAELAKIYVQFYTRFYLKPAYLLKHFLKYGLFYLFNFDVFNKLFLMYKKVIK